MKTTGVLDIGYGNINSVIESLQKLEIDSIPVRDPDVVRSIDNLIIPGVGSFDAAAILLEETGNREAILSRHTKRLPTLGICLGFQVMSLGSEEANSQEGLGIFNYSFKKLPSPEIGWRMIHDDSISVFNRRDFFYFNHGFGAVANESDVGDFAINSQRMISFAIRDATVGVQFHPEKSQRAGQAFLKWFFESRQT